MTATFPKRQWPLKLITFAKIISWKRRPLFNQRLTSGLFKTSFFHSKRSRSLIPSTGCGSLFLFGFCFFEVFWLCYVLACYNKYLLRIKMLHTRKNRCHITTVPHHNGILSTMATFLSTQSDRSREGRQCIEYSENISLFNPIYIKHE